MMMIYPKLYAEHNRIATITNEKCLEKYNQLIKWRNNPSIMEFGHGDGGTSQKTLFPYLPSNLKEFVATDYSTSMVEFARKNAILPSMEFEQLDIATKDFPSKYLGRFDHIFGFFVIHTVRNPRQGFFNIHKMLKSGGSVFLTMCEYTSIDHSMDELSRHPEWGKYIDESLISPYFYSPSPRQEWEKNLNATGFNNYEFFEDDHYFEYHNDEEFDNFLLSQCSFLPNIPVDDRETFKTYYKEVARRGKLISTEVIDGKEIISWRCKIFTIYATKS